MRIAMALLVASVAFGSACKKKEKTGDTGGQGSAPVAGSADTGSAATDTGSAAGSAAAGSAAGSGEGSAAGGDQTMSRRGGNCPSTVFGSTTTADAQGRHDRADHHQRGQGRDRRHPAPHRRASQGEDRRRRGRGRARRQGHARRQIGLCPLHLGDGGTATSKADDKGVVVTITPKDKPEALKAEIDARITKAADWVKANLKEGDKGTTGGVGGGKGEHGSNHSGEGDAKGVDRKDGAGAGSGGDGKGGGKGTGGGGGAGTGGGSGNAGSATK